MSFQILGPTTRNCDRLLAVMLMVRRRRWRSKGNEVHGDGDYDNNSGSQGTKLNSWWERWKKQNKNQRHNNRKRNKLQPIVERGAFCLLIPTAFP